MTSNVQFYIPKSKDEDLSKITNLNSELESKLNELKSEMLQKIEKELTDSQNARVFISQKYDELVKRLEFLTDLDATVTGFRSDVKAIEKQISDLSLRVDDIERKTVVKDTSFVSSLVP